MSILCLLLPLLSFLHVIVSSPIDEVPIEPKSIKQQVDYRLAADALEVMHYDIELSLNNDVFETNAFNGITQITFTILKNSKTITLHANQITFSKVTLTLEDGAEIKLTNTEFKSDQTTDFLTLTTDTELITGSIYKLIFDYSAILRTNQMYGFYKSTYTDNDGVRKSIATTQFQPTHAREAFPCFDEPLFKAAFDIKIRHPKHLNAISNAKGSSEEDGEFTLTTFQTTPRMSTYLVAFVVSDFDCSESTSQIDTDIPHSICSRVDATENRKLALDISPNLTWALEDFTKIKFKTSQLTKIDQVAIPDFAAGAMENWGLITYRETNLLWDAVESSNRYKQRAITVIAHELAHFWFGNLVTTHWWSDTFLNEGFATYFEYFITHEVVPSMGLDKQFVIEQLQAVLLSDSSPFSAALSSQVSSPAEISGRFSSISYNKGGSIIRMLQHVMGIDNFKQGLNSYLTKYQFKNTNPENLLQSLGEMDIDLPPGRSLSEVMKNWIYNPGYPVITVNEVGSQVKLNQARFLANGEDPDAGWFIPLTYTTADDTDQFLNTSTNIWSFTSGTLTILDAIKNPDDWIIFNNQQIGYYRVKYGDSLYNKIQIALSKPNFDGIHELNRAQLIDDYYNFARFGHKKFTDVLNLLRFLKHDTSYYPWYSAFGAFSNMISKTTDEFVTRKLSDYILELSAAIYKSVPFNQIENENQIFTFTKVLVVPWACKLGLQDCIDNAIGAFKEYQSSQIKPDKNLRSAIYCNGLRYSKDSVKDWNFLWGKFGETKLATEQVTILSALGCSTDEQVLKDYLKKSINATSGIRAQDALSVFSAVYGGNPSGVDVALDFFIENFDDISQYYGALNSISSLISGIANRFTRQDQIDKLKTFIASGRLGEAENAANTAVDTATSNLEWTTQFEKEITDYFTPDENNNNGASGTGVWHWLQIIATCCIILFQRTMNI